MSPFAKPQTRLNTSLWARFSARQTPLVFGICLVVGLGVVAWRAKGQAETARALARTEARARGSSIELQFSQASAAAEVLGMLARQGRGGITDFQKVATELLTAHPGLASLELQPGGVVSDIVPRAGHDRAVGFNVLKDSVQRVGANEAIARRVLTVAGPMTLDRGEQGIVARVPVFQRTPDGRDSFWGFVAVSMRLQDALSRAQVEDLVRQGYDFALFAPPGTQQKPRAIASHGLSSLQDTVQQLVRAQNLEFRLLLKPRGGWIDKTKVVLELLTLLLMSALVSLSVSLVESRRAVEAGLKEATQRLAREAADQSQAQADGRGAKERMSAALPELRETQLALQQAESKAAQLQARLDDSTHAKNEAVQVSRTELREVHAALQEAQETIAQLQTRLDTATQAEKDAALVVQEQLQQNQGALAELQARLEAATRSARESAETSAARLTQLEQSNRELKARLLVAEQAEDRVAELNGLAQTAPSGNEANSLPPLGAVEAPLESPTPAEPPVTQRAATKAAKRKKARADDQMDLFGQETLAVPAVNPPAVVAEAQAPEAREPAIPAIEIAAPSDMPSSDRPKTPTGQGERQTSLRERSKWSGPAPQPAAELETVAAAVRPTSAVTPKEDKPALSRRLPAAPPVDPAQLRKAVNQIVPLLTDQDPGAKDCLRDNRTTFRSAFTPEAYVEFEQLVKNGDFDAALEQLKKAARKHGISL